MITVKVVKDSISEKGVRLTTLVLEYPRYIHSEFMTHRVFSRNAQSSRAIPVAKQIERVLKSEWYPIFMENKAGMSADKPLEGTELVHARYQWLRAKQEACHRAEMLNGLGVHKQIVNRLLEPFSTITVIVSSTEWNNFFRLRISPDAQQEIAILAKKIRDAMSESSPRAVNIDMWHLPFISMEEENYLDLETAKKVSVARCARVSYLNHEGEINYSKDIELFNALKEHRHMSPFEHVATPWPTPNPLSNFRGWRQLRYDIESL